MRLARAPHVEELLEFRGIELAHNFDVGALENELSDLAKTSQLFVNGAMG